MRIGIDMLAVQSPWTRSRGIGRLAAQLARSLVQFGQGHEFVFYAHDGLPVDCVPRADGARSVTLRPEPSLGERHIGHAVARLAATNPDGLDVLLFLSPMDRQGGFEPPARPGNGLKLAAYLYDAIPFLFPDQYLRDPGYAGPLYRTLERLRDYDVLLADSESTAADFRRLLGLGGRQIVNVSCDTDPVAFDPDRVPLPERLSDLVLERLGVGPRFVFNLGGMSGTDGRKNALGLVDAFHRLPDTMRTTHQIVIACEADAEGAARLRRAAESYELGDRLVLVGAVSDDELRVLYTRCAAFVFPSLYEGFGLPILEAMRCGAPVVAGDNSSQPEVVGDAGLLANASDPADIAAKLRQLLHDGDAARRLGARGAERSRLFSWGRTARLTLEALSEAPGWSPPAGGGLPPRRSRRPRPRVALFSPFPPQASGVADYAARLAEALAPEFAFDLFHDPGYVPEPALASTDLGCFEYPLFDRLDGQWPYDAVLYQMGNSFYHRSIYAQLLKRPGVVTLHDFCLAGFQYWYQNLQGMPADGFRREVENFDPAGAAAILAQVPAWASHPDGVHGAFMQRGLYLNRRIFERSEAVVVHSPWCRSEVARLFPEHLEKTAVVPLGTRPEVVTAGRRAAARVRFALAADALVFGSLGILSADKMNVETVEAFAAVAAEFPAAVLVFGGADWGHEEARRRTAALGLGGRVRFLGRLTAEAYAELATAIDVGINLRRPPTHGETSAALLDLLRVGTPTVVTDVATFSAYPDAVVAKVRWPGNGPAALANALRGLAADPARRAALGRAAWDHVAGQHAWPKAAALYAEVLGRAARRRAPALRGPHFRAAAVPLSVTPRDVP